MKLEGHKAGVTGLIVLPKKNHLLSAGHDGQIILWDLKNGKVIKSVKASDKGVLALSLTSDGKNLISGGEDGAILLWKLPQLKVEVKLEGHNGAVACLSSNNNGDMLISSERNPIIPHISTIFFWDSRKPLSGQFNVDGS
jgi:WD40 repeat protein